MRDERGGQRKGKEERDPERKREREEREEHVIEESFMPRILLILEKDPTASCRLIMTGISNMIFFLFSCITGSIMQPICWITFCAKLSCCPHRAILWVRWQEFWVWRRYALVKYHGTINSRTTWSEEAWWYTEDICVSWRPSLASHGLFIYVVYLGIQMIRHFGWLMAACSVINQLLTNSQMN